MHPAEPATAAELRALLASFEDVFQGTKAELGKHHEHLVRRATEALRALPADARADILAAREGSPVYAAYLLGQLVFAQTAVAQAYLQRADDDFVDVVRQHGGLLKELRKEDLGTEALAALLQRPRDDVKRELTALITKGVTDFRGTNRGLVNFLTPAGRQVLDAEFPAQT